MCNQIIRDVFRANKIPATLEPVGLLRRDGRRPDGASLTPWASGKAIAWDFTCVHRLAASHLSTGVLEGPTVADAAEERKRSHYEDLLSTHVFEPVAIETLGAIGETSWKFLRALARRIEQETDDPREFRHLRERLAIGVQRGNAACIMEPLIRHAPSPS